MKKYLFASCCCLIAISTIGCDEENFVSLGYSVPEDSTVQIVFPITIGSEVFNSNGSHIQGIAASGDALYLSQDCHLAKVDWSGKLICSKQVINHTGDLCWYNHELFAAVALNESGGSVFEDITAGKGKIQVYDEDLNLRRETDIDRRVDGICCLDGILYVGMGAKEQPSKNAHRVNIIGRYDANSLIEISQIAEVDYGYMTYYGVENLTTDGNVIFGSFYAVSGAPQIVEFDKDLKIRSTYYLPANHGIDVVPEGVLSLDYKFVWATTVNMENQAGICCIIDGWTPKDT